MSYPDLPAQAKAAQAASDTRWMHFYWHLIKNPDFVTDPANQPLVQSLQNLGWQAALTGSPGAGLDFLAMHRHMIHHIDQVLMAAGDANWPRVSGWASFPPGPNDPDWPEPPIAILATPNQWPVALAGQLQAIANSRAPATVATNLGYAATLRSANWIRTAENGGPISLDQYGMLIEGTVHNWAHMRFAGMPPQDPWDLAPQADWLGTPFSSHVNAYFWKLHGWIDDCINIWSEATGQAADLSGAWQHPATIPPPIWELTAPMVVASSRDLGPSLAWGLSMDNAQLDPLARAISSVGFWRATRVTRDALARFRLAD